MANETNKEWFKEWFNTEYYHTLYKDRNHEEAALFIRNLTQHLTIDKDQAHILDLACGKGRHSIYMNTLGYRVKGVDLSEESIKHAARYANDKLCFDVQDMREPMDEKFTHIFNLFTSFGYFDSFEENQQVLYAIDNMLVDHGVVVIDFMNSHKVITNLVEDEVKTVDGIKFQLNRRYDGHHIYKDIRFTDNGKDFHFTERVQALQLSDFSELFDATGLQIISIFGDFNLNPFDEQTSDRLILVAKKQV